MTVNLGDLIHNHLIPQNINTLTIKIGKCSVGHRHCVCIQFPTFMNSCLFISLYISKSFILFNLHFFSKLQLFQSLFLIIIEITYILIIELKTFLSKVVLLSYELQSYYN